MRMPITTATISVPISTQAIRVGNDGRWAGVADGAAEVAGGGAVGGGADPYGGGAAAGVGEAGRAAGGGAARMIIGRGGWVLSRIRAGAGEAGGIRMVSGLADHVSACQASCVVSGIWGARS